MKYTYAGSEFYIHVRERGQMFKLQPIKPHPRRSNHKLHYTYTTPSAPPVVRHQHIIIIMRGKTCTIVLVSIQ